MNSAQTKAGSTEHEPLLVMEQIGKRFGATVALKDVSLSVYPGETIALIGENGAGKSTLMKVLSGAHAPDVGQMSIGGRPFRPNGPLDSRRAGVAMIYQELSLAPDLTVEDNIMLGQETHKAGILRRRPQRELVASILKQLGHPDLKPNRPVRSLSIGAKQLVEIARALASNARVMIFDEPTSSLPKQDVDRLFSIIQQLQSQGMAIIYISHFLEEIRRVAHRFVVLRDGQPAGSGQLNSTTDQQIVSLMAGRSVETLFPVVEHAIHEPVLEVNNLTGVSNPRDVSFAVRKGEVFGLFGLVGAGRTETLRHVFGLDTLQSGSIRLRNRAREKSLGQRPSSSIRAGVGFVSEDRKTEGLAQSMSIADNLTLSDLRPYATFGLLRLGKRKVAVRDWMTKLRVKARGPEQPIGHLSGGNQQKVAIARVMHQAADLLLLDEPTRGIDVGTKAEIYRLIGELAAEGKSIIFVSSYLPELMAVCDTIGVMARGRLREVRPKTEWDEHDVLSVAIASDLLIE
ncbi:MAG: sugar ABC transporter ATP-binding protein [Pirellulaceae bacterium]|nr:sugar ABC transporter ATP-binding protein [Pirellulaceae bacterium]